MAGPIVSALGHDLAVIRLGVLDQSPVPNGTSPAQALGDTVALAVQAELLGYSRFWLAEHHNTASVAGTCPEVMTAAVAAATTTIRVGAGGVMLSHYSPFKVAESFRTLAALFPGRIDLGVGRAAGTDSATEGALRYQGDAPVEEYFARRVIDLAQFLGKGFKETHPFGSVQAMPVPTRADEAPQLWLLASSGHSGATAASLGMSLCFAHFITPMWSMQVVAEYRRRFSPSADLDQARASLAVAVVCADTDAEAQRLAVSGEVWRLRPEGAERGPLLDPDEAAAVARKWSELDRQRAAQHRAAAIVGGPDTVTPALTMLIEQHQVEDVLVVTVCHDPAARLRSYQLLAEAYGLTAGGGVRTDR